jgi:hypothetical protein
MEVQEYKENYEMRMRLKKHNSGSATYAVGNATRWMYAIFSLFMGYGFVTVLIDGSFGLSSLIPLFFLLIGIIGLGYREKWDFDPARGSITYTIGVYMLVKVKQYRVEDADRLQVSHFVRGRSPVETDAKPRGRNKAMVVFSLHMRDDSVKDIEIIPERTSAGRTEASAQILATIMDLPFHADREPDTIQSVSVRDI